MAHAHPRSDLLDSPFRFDFEFEFLPAYDLFGGLNDVPLNINRRGFCNHDFTAHYDLFGGSRSFVKTENSSAYAITIAVASNPQKFDGVHYDFGSVSSEELQATNSMLFLLDIGLGTYNEHLLFGDIRHPPMSAD